MVFIAGVIYITAVTVEDMMQARENRMFLQQALIERYKTVLVCFTLNIAGPIKNNDIILKTFNEGLKLIKAQINYRNILIKHEEIMNFHTGNEAYFCLDSDPVNIKKIMLYLEENHPLGRLFDIDVLDIHYDKIDRQSIGYEERKCILCSMPVNVCAPRRLHTVEEIQNKTFEIMNSYFNEQLIDKIAIYCERALLYEVAISPKPGLVDRFNNGAHSDMDFFTFIDSSTSIRKYFKNMINIALKYKDKDFNYIFDMLKCEGIFSENAMNDITKNVNTHKGAIFSLALVCGAIGYIIGKSIELNYKNILHYVAKLYENEADEFFKISNNDINTSGAEIYKKYLIKGVRGEAQKGFPSAAKGLMAIKEEMSVSNDKNIAGLMGFYAILNNIEDTNICKRAGFEEYSEIIKKINKSNIDRKDIFTYMDDLDKIFISKNISAGGSADMLAISWLLYFIDNDEDII